MLRPSGSPCWIPAAPRPPTPADVRRQVCRLPIRDEDDLPSQQLHDQRGCLDDVDGQGVSRRLLRHCCAGSAHDAKPPITRLPAINELELHHST